VKRLADLAEAASLPPTATDLVTYLTYWRSSVFSLSSVQLHSNWNLIVYSYSDTDLGTRRFSERLTALRGSRSAAMMGSSAGVGQETDRAPCRRAVLPAADLAAVQRKHLASTAAAAAGAGDG